MDADGTNVHDLVKDGLMGTWSPDGQSIAYVVLGGEEGGLYVARADGSKPRRLTGGPGEDVLGPRWSADGKQLFFTRKVHGKGDGTPGRRSKPAPAVYAIDCDGRNLRRVTASDGPEFLGGAHVFAMLFHL